MKTILNIINLKKTRPCAMVVVLPYAPFLRSGAGLVLYEDCFNHFSFVAGRHGYLLLDQQR
jgi:hypothetical protein